MRDSLKEITFHGEMSLWEEHEEYLSSRGGRDLWIESMGICTWDASCVQGDLPKNFEAEFGRRGSRLQGWLVLPMHSSSCRVVGLEFRSRYEKRSFRYVLGDSEWTSVWYGMPLAIPRMESPDLHVWLVEGVFDLFALLWVVEDLAGHVVLSTTGAKLSRHQITFLKRLSPFMVHLAFDEDKAGRRATYGFEENGKRFPGALHRLMDNGIPVRVTPYAEREGDDPGSLWDRGGLNKVRERFSPHI